MGTASLHFCMLKALSPCSISLPHKLFLRTLTTSSPAKMPLITSTGKPRVILGTMTMGPDPQSGARITSLDEYNRILDKFQASGYSEKIEEVLNTSLKELGTDCV